MSVSECYRCRGKGSHSHRFGVISQEQIDEWGDDFFTAYLNGDFDEPCEVCDGNGVIDPSDTPDDESDYSDYLERRYA